MFTRYSPTSVIAAVLSILMLTACATTSTSQFDRELYLKSFIGQTSEYIYNHLDLTKMGYQASQAPVLNQNQLAYSIERPLMIPIPIPQTAVAGTGVIPIPVTASTTQGYDAALQCRIVFQLKDNIAESVSYTGRTC